MSASFDITRPINHGEVGDFIVLNLGSQYSVPTIVHNSYGAALKEANRLADKELTKQFLVLRIEKIVLPPRKRYAFELSRQEYESLSAEIKLHDIGYPGG